MRIIEPQSALLSNLEAREKIQSSIKLATQDDEANVRSGLSKEYIRDGKLQSLRAALQNVSTYLETTPSRGMNAYDADAVQNGSDEAPVLQPPRFGDVKDCITKLMKGLEPYDLYKVEIVRIMNMRPTDSTVLGLCVEELDERFDANECKGMIKVVCDAFEEHAAELDEDAMDVDGQAGAGQDEDG